MKKRYIRIGDRYLNWYGRPATKADYDLFHKNIPDVIPIKPAEIDDEPEAVAIPSDRLKGSGIPHVILLEKNGVDTFSSIPKTYVGLIALSGIGHKSAHDIADWLIAERGIVVYDSPDQMVGKE